MTILGRFVMRQFSLVLGLSLVSSVCFANNPLSVHVLNQDKGVPATNMSVILEAQNGDTWVKLNEAKTNKEGRIPEFYPKDTKLQKGVYKVTFKTADWFKKNNKKTFFPEVPVIFVVDGRLEHYHIPLLLSAYGYSTYRGN